MPPIMMKMVQCIYNINEGSAMDEARESSSSKFIVPSQTKIWLYKTLAFNNN